MNYAIQGLTCGNCIETVQKRLGALNSSAKVTLTGVTFTGPSPSFEEVRGAISDLPKYKVVENAPLVEVTPSNLAVYTPLFLVLGMICLVSFKGADDFHAWMMNYMAAFFIVFGTFKLLDLKGFANSFVMYDPIAKVFKPYAYAYPFIELALGFAFLNYWQMRPSIWVMIFISGVTSFGIIQALTNKQKIKCACLGSVFNLPMTTISLIENLSMVVMGVMML